MTVFKTVMRLYVARSLRKKNISARRAQSLTSHCLSEGQTWMHSVNWYLWTPEQRQYYRDVLLQKLLPAIWRVSGNMTFVHFPTSQRPSTSWRDTIELLHRNTPDFTAPDMWPPNSPDLNPVDYAIWSIMRQRLSRVCIRPESMSSMSCDSVLSPCGVDWNSALWMTPLISGNVVC